MGRTSNAREQLLSSGTELMHARGYTAVGVNEVCLKAGVKKGSFYHFFPSKMDLALEMIGRYAAEVKVVLDELVSGANPPLERLAAFLDRVHQGQVESKSRCGQVLGCPIGNLALEMSTQEPRLRARLDTVLSHHAHAFAMVLDEAVTKGDLPPLDTRRAGFSILALVQGSIMQAKMRDDPEILRGLREDAIKLIGGDTRVEN